MSVVIPKIDHARTTLEQRGVICLSDDEANRADIRPLRIGILNIMPKGETVRAVSPLSVKQNDYPNRTYLAAAAHAQI